MEISAGGPVMSLAMLPASQKIMLMQLDSKLPFEVFAVSISVNLQSFI